MHTEEVEESKRLHNPCLLWVPKVGKGSCTLPARKMWVGAAGSERLYSARVVKWAQYIPNHHHHHHHHHRRWRGRDARGQKQHW